MLPSQRGARHGVNFAEPPFPMEGQTRPTPHPLVGAEMQKERYRVITYMNIKQLNKLKYSSESILFLYITLLAFVA